jgi:excisionase family DNA binding protein
MVTKKNSREMGVNS